MASSSAPQKAAAPPVSPVTRCETLLKDSRSARAASFTSGVVRNAALNASPAAAALPKAVTAASVSRSEPLATSQGGATLEKSHRRNRTRPCVTGGATHASAAQAAAAQGSKALSTDASSKARAAAVAAAKPGLGDAGRGDAGRGDAGGAVDARDATDARGRDASDARGLQASTPASSPSHASTPPS